jgi:hypothetical protein
MLSLGSASHNKVSVSAIDTPNPDRHSGMLLAGMTCGVICPCFKPPYFVDVQLREGERAMEGLDTDGYESMDKTGENFFRANTNEGL